MQPVSHRYMDQIKQMMKSSRGAMVITPDNVYQPGNSDILQYIDIMVRENLGKGSGLQSFENLMALAKLAAEGKSCLILMEHYSNFDLPVFHYLLRQQGEAGIKAAENLIAIAGYKLNETNPVVTAFTEAYSRLVIYPSRSLEGHKATMKDAKELLAEMMKSNSINHATMKKLNELKIQNKLILVFPSGTRYRPWDPSTKRGVREIDSYLRSFDYMALVSINGGVLTINPAGEMQEDLIGEAKVVYDVSPPIDCNEFRNRIKHTLSFSEDRKQAIVDAVMEGLEAMHNTVEKTF